MEAVWLPWGLLLNILYAVIQHQYQYAVIHHQFRMQLSTTRSQIRRLRAGETISYNAPFQDTSPPPASGPSSSPNIQSVLFFLTPYSTDSYICLHMYISYWQDFALSDCYFFPIRNDFDYDYTA